MCGFVGFIDLCGKLSDDELHSVAMSMSDAIYHRGPDDGGIWIDKGMRLSMGFRRLSILELSPAGSQPMISSSGRWVITFNGEIYNHRQIRKGLDKIKKYAWHGHSDTETILEAIEHYGINGAIERANGMFALAVWDVKERNLFLVRDRIGKKPIYWGLFHNILIFGSELKSFLRNPLFEPQIDRNAICSLLQLTYIPSYHSIYQNVSKVTPGEIIKISFTSSKNISIDTHVYWSLDEVIHTNANCRPIEQKEMIESLELLIDDAVSLRMLADVPLGALLSGGIDSTLVTALMQKNSDTPIKTFSIGFELTSFNEAAFAKKTANYLGTDHNELYISSQNAQDVIQSLPDIYDEPFADSSQIPTFLVSKFAKEQVKVALSGDGGDESFCGYERYPHFEKICMQIESMPWSVRKLLKSGSRIKLGLIGDLLIAGGEKYLTNTSIFKRLTPGMIRAIGEAICGDRKTLYGYMCSHWKDATEVVLGSERSIQPWRGNNQVLNTLSPIDGTMYLDSLNYLPDEILVKVDRASMANSLEVRSPLLDYRIVEFAWGLPSATKYHNGTLKKPLKLILDKYVPQELTDRPKHGFSVPISEWLRTSLRDWAEALLDPILLEKQGYFSVPLVRRIWRNHLEGNANMEGSLWSILMFQAWASKMRL